MKRWYWPGLLVLTVLLSIGALSSQIEGFSSYISAFSSRPAPPLTTKADPHYQAVYLVIIDGLRCDAAYSPAMPFLGKLIDDGAAWGRARAGLPSYSRPSYARLITGAPSELTGLTTDDQEAPAPVPTLFSLASAAGLSTAASAHQWIRDLAEERSGATRTGRMAGRWIQHGYFYRDGGESDALVFANARDQVRLHAPQLLVIVPMGVDRAGHAEGGDSPAYRRAAAEIDNYLADFYYSLPERDFLLVITADHGHIDAGGHGGREEDVLMAPLILAGAGVRPGRLPGDVDQLDLAPTIAAALGLPMAGSMGGRVLSEAFTDETSWRARQEALQAAQYEYVSANADLLSIRAHPGVSFAAAWEEARSAARLQGVLLRSFPGLILAALAFYALFLHWRNYGWQWPILAGLTYPLYHYALLRLLGASYSYSAIAEPLGYALRVGAAGIVALLVLTWAGAALRRSGERFLDSTCLGAWVAQVTIALIAWVIVGGGRFSRFLPDPTWHNFLRVQLGVAGLVALFALSGLAAERLADAKAAAAER